MLIIILHHFCVHGVMAMLEHPPYPMTVENLDWQLVLTQMVGWGGNMANGVFMIITGYFMVTRQMKYKKIVVLILTMLFYSWLIGGIFGFGGLTHQDSKALVKSLISPWIGLNWFVSCYILFSFFIPFINPFLNKLSAKRYWQLLLLIFFVYTVMPTFKGSNFLQSAQLVYFFFMYAIGGFIQLHLFQQEKFHSHKFWGKYLALSVGVLLLTIALFDAAGVMLHRDVFVKHAWHFVNIMNVFISVFLFLYFATLPKFYSKTINRAAASILGIYLIHDNQYIREYVWSDVLPNQAFLHSAWFPVLMVGKVLAVFLICLAIDQLRIRTVEPIYKGWVDRHWTWFCKQGQWFSEKCGWKY